MFYRLTVEQYHQLIEAEVLVSGDPVELVEGVLLYKMTQKPRHPVCLWLLQHHIAPLVPNGFHYHTERAITLEDGEPEPDGAILRGSVMDFVDHHPGPADVELVIEVADASLRRDRGTKLCSYARAGIACYWIVNLIDRCVEVYRDPQSAAEPPTYGTQTIYREADELPVVIASNTVGCIAVAGGAAPGVTPPDFHGRLTFASVE